MARLTKKQKEELFRAREEEQAEAEKARLAAMPLTLLSLMARADECGLGYQVMTNALGDLTVQFSDKYGDRTHLLLTSSSSAVYNVTLDIESKEEELAEQRALAARRHAAIAKLTKEDLTALGLN